MKHRYHDISDSQADNIRQRRRNDFDELTRLFAWIAVFLVLVTFVAPHFGGGW